MAKLITTDSQLFESLPNQITAVAGEKTLIKKIGAYLTVSELWVVETFLGNYLYEEMQTRYANKELLAAVCRVIAPDALMRAIPALDLVLTPNGFGVVSNQNVAPASKERVERLLASLERNRDMGIEAMLPMLLHTAQNWHGTKQFTECYSTMFPYPQMLEAFLGEHRWTDYQKLLPQIKAIEAKLAAEYFSPEFMNELRFDLWEKDENKVFIPWLRNVEMEILRTGEYPRETLIDMVNYLRKNQEDFPAWAYSDTAKLFSPPIFTNKKQSSGYFF